MKKWILALTIVGVFSLLGFGVVMAQDTTPDTPGDPGCSDCPRVGAGYLADGALHEYMTSAIANVLGISPEEFETFRQDGLTLYQIAEELEIDLDDLREQFAQVRTEAIETAFADGAITEDAYQFLLERAQFGKHFGGGMGGGKRNGGGFGGMFGGSRGPGGFGQHDCPYNQPEPTN